MAQRQTEMVLRSPEQTEQFARVLSSELLQGDTVLLSGDIGAGKTHFCRAAIQSLLQIPEDIPSPTFTLVQTYDTIKGELWHADLYRLTDPFELVELGLTDAFEEAIVFIEWPDRLGSLAPQNALCINLALIDAEEARLLTISSSSPRWDFMHDK